MDLDVLHRAAEGMIMSLRTSSLSLLNCLPKNKNKVKCIAVKGVPKRIKHRVYGGGNIETSRNFFHLVNKLLAKLFDLSILKLELRSEMSGSVFLTLI